MSITTKKDYPDGYPSDASEVLRIMSFTNGKNVRIVGSMSLRSQVYAGDYDATEIVDVIGTRQLVVRDLVKKFKQIIRDLKNLPNTYIGDIKSGSVEEWVIIHDTYDYDKSIEQLEKLHDEGIITPDEYREGKRRIKPNVSKLELLGLRRDFRPNIIRWTPLEVLTGYKILKDRRRFTLIDAFQSPTITKLDVVSWVQNNRFTDFSMIYQFKSNGNVINRFTVDIEKSIRENIFMLHHEGNYFKMAKRIFALAKYKGYNDVLEKLSPLFNGDVGRIYMVYGDIGTLESLFDIAPIVPFSKVNLEIDQFKGRLSNVSLTKYIRRENDLFKMLDKITNIHSSRYSRKEILEIFRKTKTILSNLMSFYAKTYLTKVNLMPSY
jgi:hypothetical protein